MYKPAFVLEGCNILDVKKLTRISFQVKGIGKRYPYPIFNKKF